MSDFLFVVPLGLIMTVIEALLGEISTDLGL